jgi:hypothetical protein
LHTLAEDAPTTEETGVKIMSIAELILWNFELTMGLMLVANLDIVKWGFGLCDFQTGGIGYHGVEMIVRLF